MDADVTHLLKQIEWAHDKLVKLELVLATSEKKPLDLGLEEDEALVRALTDDLEFARSNIRAIGSSLAPTNPLLRRFYAAPEIHEESRVKPTRRTGRCPAWLLRCFDWCF